MKPWRQIALGRKKKMTPNVNWWYDENDSTNSFQGESGHGESNFGDGSEHEKSKPEGAFGERNTHEDASWCEEKSTQYSWGREDINKVETWDEDEPPDQTSYAYTYEFESNNSDSCDQFDLQLLTFSGHKHT